MQAGSKCVKAERGYCQRFTCDHIKVISNARIGISTLLLKKLLEMRKKTRRYNARHATTVKAEDTDFPSKL